MKKKLKVFLSQDGSISNIEIPLRLRKDSYLKVDFLCYIPKEIDITTTTIVKIYASGISEKGEKVWTSQTYNMPYLKDEAVKNRAYSVFGNAFPQEFCEANSDIYVTIACIDATESGDVVLLQTTATLNLTIYGEGYNANDVVLGENEKTVSQLNSLLKLAKLKINVSDIKDGVYYSEDGYKSPFYEFYPVVYSLPNVDGVKVSKECSVVATQIVADSASPEVVGYQTEYAYADDGVYIRTNKYNISQASIGNYTLLTSGEWKLANQQMVEQVAEVASGNTKSIEELALHVDEGLASVNTKVDENQTALTNKINTDVNNLSESVNTELSKINKKVDTGTNYVGQYPTRDTMPSNDELNTFVSSKMSRAPQRGDEVNFVLQVENGVDKVYTFKYSEADSTWDIIEIPGAELAGNNDAGYIIGTNRAENEEKLISGIVKMLLDIQSGEIKDIKVYNKNIEKVVSLIASVVLYDGENRILASELYGKDADGSFSYAKLSNNVIEIGDHTKVSLYKGKNKKVYYSWIEDGAVKSDSFAYDGDIGDYSLLEGKTIIDYCVDLYNAHVETKQKLETDITKLNEAIAAETQRATNALSEESARLEGLVTAETQRATTALNAETERAAAAENKLNTDKLDKASIAENYFKDIVFSLNGDTGVATGTYKNPVTGVETTLEIHVISPASTSSAGLMTADMVTALNKALVDIEALKYEGRQLQVFDTYADAQLFDWSTVSSINVEDFFIVLKDETRTADEKDKTTRYNCTSLTAPITTENNFTYSGLVTTVVIQVATESEVGGVLSVNQAGYIYVEPTGAMKLVGYDAILSSIATLNQNLSSEIARAKAAEEANASAVSEEKERAQAQELELSNNKADRSELPTKTSELDNDGDGTSPFARQSDLPTKVSELDNDANYAKTEQLPTALSQLQDDIGVSDKANRSELFSKSYNDLTDKPENIVTTDTDQDITGQKSFHNGINNYGYYYINWLQLAMDDGSNLNVGDLNRKLVLWSNSERPQYKDVGELALLSDVNTAIAGLGTVFDLKGTKATVDDLPTESNSIGDVWYVVAEKVGYVWLNDGTTDRWEQFGAPIDLSGYVTTETFTEFQTQVQEMSVGMTTMVSDVRSELLAEDEEIKATIPTATSQLTNDSGFLTSESIANMAKTNVDNNFTTSQTITGTVTATAFNANSDRRLKENIKDYTCFRSILDLPIKEFDYKKTGIHAIGCIAQDLQEICPEIVNIDKDGYLSIQESKLVYLLLQEVKELKAEIDKLKEI